MRHHEAQDHRAQNWKTEHRTWQDRGGYHGYRIPQARFQGYFGPEHGFRASRFPMRMVGGMPRFRMNGFNFSVMDPWPEYWAENWYAQDEMYVAFTDGGYYLYNNQYPEDRIALSVSLN